MVICKVPIAEGERQNEKVNDRRMKNWINSWGLRSDYEDWRTPWPVEECRYGEGGGFGVHGEILEHKSWLTSAGGNCGAHILAEECRKGGGGVLSMECNGAGPVQRVWIQECLSKQRLHWKWRLWASNDIEESWADGDWAVLCLWSCAPKGGYEAAH